MPLSKNFEKSRIKLCEALLDISLTELENDTPSKRGKAFNTYYSAFEFMRSNIHNKLNRETVAKACSITPSHLSKLFNRFAKEDFNQSLKRLRIEHSIFLLEKSSLSVNEIAFLCGFKTSAHFIRIFRQINSTSPGRFRNSNSRKTGLL
jgi:transcriptional regulator GlxA family with amidase domain